MSDLRIAAGDRTEVFAGQPVTAGRSADCDFTVDQPMVSRRHLTVRHQGDEWIVSDESSGGTFLDDGQRITRPTVVDAGGVRLRLGAKDGPWVQLSTVASTAAEPSPTADPVPAEDPTPATDPESDPAPARDPEASASSPRVDREWSDDGFEPVAPVGVISRLWDALKSKVARGVRPLWRTVALMLFGALFAYIGNVFVTARYYDGYNVPEGAAVMTGQSSGAAAVIWFVATMVATAWFGYLLNVGPRRFLQAAIAAPGRAGSFFTAGGHFAAGVAMMALGTSLMVSGVVVPALALVLGLGLLSTLPSGIGYRVAATIGTTVNRALGRIGGRHQSQARGMTAAGMVGAALALMLRYEFNSFLVRLMLGMVVLIVGFRVLSRRPAAVGPATIVLVMAVAVAMLHEIGPALADDGGWSECGGTWSGFLGSDCTGSGQLLKELLDALGVGTLGGFVGTIISRDRDGDGQPDYWGFDKNNDGIPDVYFEVRPDGMRRIRTVVFGEDGTAHSTTTTYDNDGNKVARRSDWSGGVEYEYYDSRGRLIERESEVRDELGVPTGERTTTYYDGSGDINRQVKETPYGDRVEIEFEDYEHGNAMPLPLHPHGTWPYSGRPQKETIYHPGGGVTTKHYVNTPDGVIITIHHPDGSMSQLVVSEHPRGMAPPP